jgi:hypothetical protein
MPVWRALERRRRTLPSGETAQMPPPTPPPGHTVGSVR